MSGFAARSNEIQAVTDLLESDEFEDAEQLARAIVSAVAKELRKRKVYVVVAKGAPFGYGPYWTQNEAADDWLNEGLGAAMGNVPGDMLPVIQWVPANEEVDAGLCECGHYPEQHVVKPKSKRLAECGVCDDKNVCKQYERKAA